MHLTAPSDILDFGQQMGLSQKLVDQYFGAWAIEPQRFQGLVDHVRSINLVAHIQANRDTFQALGEPQAAAGDRKPYDMTRDGVAIISIDGPMQKYASSFSGATSTVRVRQQVNAAARDEDVTAILLMIDSPGGTVAGTQDLAAAINQAKAKKPVWAFIEDMAASAAYWVASQADKVFANQPTATIGSIGTFAVLTDLSVAAEKLGAKVHVVRAGQFKGAGVPGTPIEDQHLAEWQRLVDAMNAEFLGGVASGRKMSAATVESLADGRVHPANEAVSLGLIDGVQDVGQTLADLVSSVQVRRGPKMTTETSPAAQPATLADLKAAFPTASSDFILKQLEANATLLVATQAFAADQAAQVQQLQQQLAERDQKMATIQQSATPLKLPGVRPLKMEDGKDEDEAPATDPVAAFDQLVRGKVSAGMDRRAACLAVARENPQLHQSFLVATNPGRKAQRLIAEKYDLDVA